MSSLCTDQQNLHQTVRERIGESLEFESGYLTVPELESFGREKLCCGCKTTVIGYDRIENQIASWLQRLTKQVTADVAQEKITRGIKVIAGLSKHAVLRSTIEQKQLNFISTESPRLRTNATAKLSGTELMFTFDRHTLSQVASVGRFIRTTSSLRYGGGSNPLTLCCTARCC